MDEAIALAGAEHIIHNIVLQREEYLADIKHGDVVYQVSTSLFVSIQVYNSILAQLIMCTPASMYLSTKYSAFNEIIHTTQQSNMYLHTIRAQISLAGLVWLYAGEGGLGFYWSRN